MFFNNTLKKVKKEEVKDNYGYAETTFKPTKQAYEADVQPYSKELLKKEYGLVANSVTYRCFLKKRGLSLMDYVEVDNQILQVILIHEWESHIEIVLGVSKSGQKE